MSGPLQPREEMCGSAHVAPTCGPLLEGAGWTAAHKTSGLACSCFASPPACTMGILGSEIKPALKGTFEILLWALIKTWEHPRLMTHHPLPHETRTARDTDGGGWFPPWDHFVSHALPTVIPPNPSSSQNDHQDQLEPCLRKPNLTSTWRTLPEVFLHPVGLGSTASVTVYRPQKTVMSVYPLCAAFQINQISELKNFLLSIHFRDNLKRHQFRLQTLVCTQCVGICSVEIL